MIGVKESNRASLGSRGGAGKNHAMNTASVSTDTKLVLEGARQLTPAGDMAGPARTGWCPRVADMVMSCPVGSVLRTGWGWGGKPV